MMTGVCVCVHPWTKGFVQPIHLPRVPPPIHKQGRQARYTYLTQRSSGVSRDGWTDHPPVPASTVEQAVPILLFDSMVVHDTSHKPFHFLTQLNCTEARHRTPVETLFNNTVLLTHAPFRSLTFLPNVGTESLKTNVRVCFAQPSHSGAECDPRHRGAVFCIGNHPPQLATFHRISTGSH